LEWRVLNLATMAFRIGRMLALSAFDRRDFWHLRNTRDVNHIDFAHARETFDAAGEFFDKHRLSMNALPFCQVENGLPNMIAAESRILWLQP